MKFLYKIFFIILLIISIPLTFLNNNNIFADETNSILFSSNLDCSTQAPGGKVKFEVFATSQDLTTLSTFKININFDDSKLYYKSIKASDLITSGTLKLKEDPGSITALYLEGKNGLKLESEKVTSLFEMTFSSDENIDYDLINISASIDFAVDSNYQPANISNSMNQSFIISRPLPANSSLQDLIPSCGSLVPEFNPDITNYYVDVDSDVDSITFDAIPTDDNSIVKINKKRLGKQGSSTEIDITVNASDRSSSTVYCVNVNRLTVSDEAASLSPSSKASTSSKNSNSSKASASSKASTATAYKSSKSSSSSNKSSNLSLNTNKANKATSENTDSSQNPYTQIGHNLVMRENSFNIFLLFILMIVCLVCAALLIKKNHIKKKK